MRFYDKTKHYVPTSRDGGVLPGCVIHLEGDDASLVNLYDTKDSLFVRNTIASKNDGSSVLANVPRFEGIGSVVQAGTVNMLTANQAGVTTNLVGIHALNDTETLTRVTDSQYVGAGTGAVKIDTLGNNNSEGAYWDICNVIPGATYTVSAYVCGSGEVEITLSERNVAGEFIGEVNSTTCVLTNTPQRISRSKVLTANGYGIILKVHTRSTGEVQVITFYASGMQVECAASATPWIAGQTRRATTYDKSGLTVEEGTTNLLTAAQAGVTTDTAVYTKRVGTETLSVDNGAQFRILGTNALKVVTPGDVLAEGFSTVISTGSLTADQTYTVSCWICGTGIVHLGIVENNVTTAFGSAITLTATPTRYSATRTFTGNNKYALRLETVNSAQAATFYASGLQIEQKSYATSWMPGGAGRNGEVYTVPSVGVISVSQGTVEMLVDCAALRRKTASSGQLFSAATGNNRFYLYYNAVDFTLYFDIRDNDLNEVTCSSGAIPVTGIARIAARWKSDEIVLVMNGVKKVPIEVTTQLPDAINANIYIGCSSAPSNWTNAQISDIVFSNIARSDTELANRGVLTPLGIDENTTYYLPLVGTINEKTWKSPGKVLDRSGHGNHAAVTGAYYVPKPYGSALCFDAIDDQAIIPSAPSNKITGGITLMAWVKPHKVSTTGYNVILAKGGSYFLETNLGVFVYRMITDNGGGFLISSDVALEADQVYHTAITFDGATVNGYLNGKLDKTAAHAGNLVTNDNDVYIGAEETWGNRWNGEIGCVQGFNRVMTSTEIKAIFERDAWKYGVSA